jgi:RNA polymerase sigma factor (sigma-70 family)
MTTTSQGTRLSLLHRARRNDPNAWRQLNKIYSPLIESWCRRAGLTSHDTADCVQDVFLAVSHSLASYTPQKTSGSFRAWLWTITRNKLRDHFRRNSREALASGGTTANRRISAIADPLTVPECEPSRESELQELTLRGLRIAQAEFEQRTWQAFWRSAVDGLPTVVVSEELSMTEETVRQSRSRILRRLRQLLGDLE